MAKAAAKNNVLRLLETKGVDYIHYCYDTEDGKIAAVSVAMKINRAPEEVFKTLVTRSEGPRYYVFVVPGCCELDLKKAAEAVGEKNIEMIKSKELLPLTGYIHGGCSPIGMKKFFPTVVDISARDCPKMLFSGGHIGCQVEVSPSDLEKVIPLKYADIVE